MKRHSFSLVVIALVLLLDVSGCAPRSPQENSALLVPGNSTDSPQKSVAAMSLELPNGWQLRDFIVAGFDKDGSGDFGCRATLDEGQFARLAALLDMESWKELETPIEYGLTATLSLADKDIERFLTVMNGGEFGTVISLAGQEEKRVYTAPAQVAEEARELDTELQEQSEEPVNEPASSPSDTFYPAAAAYLEYDGSAIRGRHSWNEDGTLTFQHQNTLTTLSVDNQVIEAIALPVEYLPEDSVYELTWSESRILAIDRTTEESRNQYGVVYFTDDGGVHLANLTLFDRQGNLVRQYYHGQVAGYDEDGNYVYYLPCPDGTEMLSDYSLGDSCVFWLDDETVILECHSRVVLYDFAADSGRILDDMDEFVRQFGKFGVYYGVDHSQRGVIDGSFYYLAHRTEKGNTAGTVWRADKSGAAELFGGREFWHLFVGEGALITAEDKEPKQSDGIDSRVYCADVKTLELKEIWQGEPFLPFTDKGRISFHNWAWDEGNVTFYSYDADSGELSSHGLGRLVQVNRLISRVIDGSLRYYYTLFEDGTTTDWVYDTETDTTTELTEYGLNHLDEIPFSPDGEHYVEYNAGYIEGDAESEQPMLRVRHWAY